MKKNRWYLRMAAMLALSLVLSCTVSLAAEAGSSQDPLVTLSYLNDTFLGQILEKVDAKIAQRNSQIVQQLGGQTTSGGTATASAFTVVTLSSGQVLTGDIGCEVMLRVGTATCVAPSSPGLIDESAATTLAGGALFGFLPAGIAFMVVIQIGCGQRRWFPMTLVSVAPVLLVYAIMRFGLGVPMP